MTDMRSLDLTEFLTRLMNTSAGQQVIAERNNEILERRKAAAAKLLCSEYDEDIAQMDTALMKKDSEITALAERLTKAQQAHGELVQRRHKFVNQKLSSTRQAQEYLERTAPSELLEFVGFSRMVRHAAKFRSRRAENKQDTRNLLERADRAHKNALALVLTPDASVEEVARLRSELNAPSEFMTAWQGTPLHFDRKAI